MSADPAEIEKFARLAGEWWDRDGAFKTLHDINPLRLDYIEKQVRVDGTKVLDVGCGGGLLSEALARAGADVLGIDLAQDSIAAAQAHAKDGKLDIEYRCIDVGTVAADAPGRYDIVTCLEMLEHVPAPEEIVAACAAAAKPGGRLFFSTINRNWKSFLLAIVGAEYALGLLPKGTHEYEKLIRPAELSQACRAAALDVIDITGLHLNPLSERYSLGGNVDVNYFLTAGKPAKS